LKRMGIRVVMLTGDRRRTGEAIGNRIGVDEVHAELLPEDKVRLIQELEKKYGRVAMAGDGVNDAPALAMASVGIAMGRAGTDVALDVADVVLMNDDLDRVATTLSLGRRTRNVIVQNLVFASLVIFSLILANFRGHISLPFGVVGHEGSTIPVILNGLRLLRGGEMKLDRRFSAGGGQGGDLPWRGDLLVSDGTCGGDFAASTAPRRLRERKTA